MNNSAKNVLACYGSKEYIYFTFVTFLSTDEFTGVYSRSLFCAQTESSVFGAGSVLLQSWLQCQLKTWCYFSC